MNTQVNIPNDIHAWKDNVGGSFIGITVTAINDFNRAAENFVSTYEAAAAMLQRSILYSSREGEIRSLTVSA